MKYFQKLFREVAIGIFALLIANDFLSGVRLEIIPGQTHFFSYPLTKKWQLIILLGSVLGLMNFFIRPFLKTISFPIRLLTFGLFSLIIDVATVWFTSFLFRELVFQNITSLLETTIIVWILELLIL